MKAAIIKEPRSVEIVDVPKPEIKQGQILVKSHTVAVCGSDMPHFLNEQPFQYPLPPGVPGHECIGTVAETCSEEFQEGDIVLAIPAIGAGFAEYFTAHPARTVNIPRLEPRFVVAQPLGTVIHACRKLFQPVLPDPNSDRGSLCRETWDLRGRTVAIVGQGPIGLLFTAMMKLMDPTSIIGLDLVEHRLAVTQRMGATHVINCSDGDIVARVRDITHGEMVDLAIEAVGKDSTVNDCCRLVKRNGTVITFGVPRKSVYDFEFQVFFSKEVKLLGSLGPDVQSEFPIAVDLIANGEIDVMPLISHHMHLDDIQKAFEFATEHKEGAVKILLSP